MRHLLTLLVLLALPTASFATAGDIVASYASGEYTVTEVLLCDGAPTTCVELDLHTGPAGLNSWPGLPEFLVYEVRADNCTDTVEGFVTGQSTAGGTAHDLHTTNFDLGVAASSLYLPFTHRFINFRVTGAGAAGVCNDFELVVRLISPRHH